MDDIAAVYINIDELIPNPNNPRREQPIEEVAKSIKNFGFGAPIVARKENHMIIAGHTRYFAAKDLGTQYVPCRFMDISQQDAIKLALADNKIGELARWEDEKLKNILLELEQETEISDLGWTEGELDKLLEELRDDPVGPDEPITTDAEAPADSKTGELYQLGDHWLICGDSSSQDIWDTLLAAAETAPSMALTDPPYDVGYSMSFNKAMLGKDAGLQNQYTESKTLNILDKVLSFLPDLVVMTYPLDRHFWQLADTTKAAGFVSLRALSWVKQHHSFHPAATYQQQHEPVLVLRRKGQKYPTSIPAGTTTVIQSENSLVAHTDHPTEKPIDVWLKLLKWHTDEGETLIDPFGGSGTTLIAAAMSGRKALLIEKSPHFCDVIRRRWTAYNCEVEK